MPTYDYQCDACDHQWELFQKITEDPESKCPECKKKKARRLFGTGAAIMFKGSGFYETDYRSESYKKGVDAEKKRSESKSNDSKSDTKKTEAKSATKTDKSESKTNPTKNKSGD